MDLGEADGPSGGGGIPPGGPPRIPGRSSRGTLEPSVHATHGCNLFGPGHPINRLPDPATMFLPRKHYHYSICKINQRKLSTKWNQKWRTGIIYKLSARIQYTYHKKCKSTISVLNYAESFKCDRDMIIKKIGGQILWNTLKIWIDAYFLRNSHAPYMGMLY